MKGQEIRIYQPSSKEGSSQLIHITLTLLLGISSVLLYCIYFTLIYTCLGFNPQVFLSFIYIWPNHIYDFYFLILYYFLRNSNKTGELNEKGNLLALSQ